MQVVGRFHARVQRHVGVNALALDFVRGADDGGFGDLGMGHQSAFDLGRAHAVARYVDDVVHPPGNPVIAVFVPAAAVAGEVFSGVGGKIGFHETVVGVVQRPCLTGPGIGDAEVAGRRPFQLLAVVVDQ